MSAGNVRITWVEQVVRLCDLRPFERNPRRITKEQYGKLVQSLVEDGYHSRIKVTRDLRMIGGHQRLKVLQELGFEEIEVLVPSEDIDDEAFKRILIRDNHANGTWDVDELASMFDLEELRSFGVHEFLTIPPEDAEEKAEAKPGKRVCCPNCQEEFLVKGNTVKVES